MTRLTLAQLRRAFAEDLRVVAPIRKNPRLAEAFATVRREDFCGPGPWTIRGDSAGGAKIRTPDSNPAWLQHNVLVALDKKQGINNGSPMMWAFLLDQISVKPGDTVLQVGAGAGYYTAILAHLVGRRGRIHAVEYDQRLAIQAAVNLKHLPQVRVIQGDAAAYDPGEQIDVVVAFAGGTHPAPLWLDRLAPRGRLLMPLTGDDRGGFMLKAVRRGSGFTATALCRCWFILAAGFRDPRAVKALQRTLRETNGGLPQLRALHRGPAPKTRARVFYSAPSFWLEGA